MAVLNPDQSKGTQPAVSGHNRNLLNVLTAQAPQAGENVKEEDESHP